MPENGLGNIDELILVYRSAGTGALHEQPASELVDSGTLIDPEAQTPVTTWSWSDTAWFSLPIS